MKEESKSKEQEQLGFASELAGLSSCAEFFLHVRLPFLKGTKVRQTLKSHICVPILSDFASGSAHVCHLTMTELVPKYQNKHAFVLHLRRCLIIKEKEKKRPI